MQKDISTRYMSILLLH